MREGDIEVALHKGHPLGLGGPRPDPRHVSQPPRQPASSPTLPPLQVHPPSHHTKVLLGVDVGPEAEDDGEAEVVGGVEEGADVGLPREGEDARLRLVAVPGDVGLDGVEAGGGGAGEAVPPVGLWDLEVVDGAARVAPLRPVLAERIRRVIKAQTDSLVSF